MRFARREAAIVSPYAGTTRDVIEVHLDLNGYPVTLLDTAGVRESSDPVEIEGVNRARARAAEADLVLWVVDASVGGVAGVSPNPRPPDGNRWLVVNKVDLVDRDSVVRCYEYEFARWTQIHAVSARQGAGLDSLLAALAAEASAHLGTEAALITRARHRQALEDTAEALARALHQNEEELAAEELRLAGRALGRLTGRVDVEDVLDVIFRDFCIGK